MNKQHYENMKVNHIDIVIVHYNTSGKLLRCLQSLSIEMRIPFTVHLFDNSDTIPYNHFWDKNCDLVYYDNTQGQLVDFTGKIGKLDYCSYTHAKSVQYMCDTLNKPFILLDSDVVVLKDLTPIIDESVYVSSDVVEFDGETRFLPHCMYLNLQSKYNFFDENRIRKTATHVYDTAQSLYEDVINTGKVKLIRADEYVWHEGHGSVNFLLNKMNFSIDWDAHDERMHFPNRYGTLKTTNSLTCRTKKSPSFRLG